MAILFHLFLLFPSCALDVVRSGDHLLLRDALCAEVEAARRSMSDWRGTRCDRSQTPQVGRDGCEVDVTSCVPSFVAKLHDVRPKYSGPNCWNLALVSAGALPALRYSSAEEMEIFLHSPLCRILAEGDVRRPGDIGTIRSLKSGGLEEEHAFVYVSDRLSFSKNGAGDDSSFSLQASEKILSIYGVPAKTECRGNATAASSGCKLGTWYFRCGSMRAFLENHPDLPTLLAQSFPKIEAVERKIMQRGLSGSDIPYEVKSELLTFALDLAGGIEREAVRLKARADVHFLLDALLYRLDAIGIQLRFAEDKFLAVELNTRVLVVRRALAQMRSQKTTR